LEVNAPVKVLACGRRWGKSEVAAVEIVRALRESVPKQILLVAPSLEQCLPIFERVYQFACEPDNLLQPVIRHSPYPYMRVGESRLVARSVARGGLYLRGKQAHLIIVDEAAYVPEAVVKEVLMPMLADTCGRLVLVSTPRGKNYFYRMFLQGQENDPAVWSLQSPTSDNPWLPDDFVQMQREWMTTRQYEVEYGAAFLDPGGQVFQTEWIDKAVLLDKELDGEVAAGVDWARYRDYTAVVILQGTRSSAKMLAARRWQNMAWGEQIQQVTEYIQNHHGNRVLCDRTGVGDPLFESLSDHLSLPAEGIVFTSEIKRRLIEQLALGFEKGRLQLLPERTLLQELYHFEASTLGERVKFEAASGYADDLVIALALAYEGLSPARHSVVRTSGKIR
jgi:phage FluMu gp28-like protein